MSPTKPDLRLIVCNLSEGTSYAAAGSKAYLLQVSGGDGRKVLVRSHSGRWVEIWRPVSKLRDFRVVTVVESMPLYERLADYATQDEETLAMICENSNQEKVTS